MKFVKIITISFLGILVCAGASADQPATRPAANSYNSQVRRALRALVVGKTADVRPPTQQEWDEMIQFMEKNSPARAMVLESIPLNHETSPIALAATRRWRNYLFTSQHFPAIADDLVRGFQLEDDLFALTLRDRADGGAEAMELRDKIQAKIGQIVQLEFKERQARIDRLQSILADEKARLQKDQASEEDIVDRRTDMIIHRMQKLNPNLAPPTTLPSATSSTDDDPPTASQQGVMSVSDPANPPAN